MNQYEMIRTAYRVYGESISEMGRTTGHSRNTIKKAIRGEPWGYKERNHQPFPILESDSDSCRGRGPIEVFLHEEQVFGQALCTFLFL